MKRFTLEVFTRSACHLCDDAVPVVDRVARVLGADVVVTDIDTDAELAVDLGLRVPVVVGPSGRILAEGSVVFGRLLRAAARERLRRRPVS